MRSAARALPLLALSVLLFSCGGGGGSSAPVYVDPVRYSSLAGSGLASAAELSSVTHHQIVVGGATLAYTATAGHLSAVNPATGRPEASFFYVAYTLDGASAATRPVTFFYNGGPGSASVWLHLGSFGPRRLVTGDPLTTAPTPFPLVDNAQSLLDTSDLVFVDAIGTGFSEAILPNTNSTFWGVDADAAAFRDFIVRYLAASGRQASPLFLFGESYGTTRSAVLANLLETAGVTIHGVVLQSSVLDYNANCGVAAGPAVPCTGYLPTYGAIGAWYQLDVPNPPDAGLPAFVSQVEAFATSTYAPALAPYFASGTLPPPATITQLADYTGIGTGAWQANFNFDPASFQSGLVAGTLIGRYDARVSARNGTPLAADGDPSSTFITPSFTSAIGAYLSLELGFTTPSTYTVTSSAIQTWNFAHDGLALPDVIPDLASAFTLNPRLKVLSANGYYDLATPFLQTQGDLARLGVNPGVSLAFYRGGHMTYLDDAARALEKSDLVAFYALALGP